MSVEEEHGGDDVDGTGIWFLQETVNELRSDIASVVSEYFAVQKHLRASQNIFLAMLAPIA